MPERMPMGQPEGERCSHGIPFTEQCEACEREAIESQPAWQMARRLQGQSRAVREDPDAPTTRVEIEKEKFSIEAIESREDPMLAEVQALFEKTFGKEEIDPEEVLRSAVEGKTPFGTEEDVIYRVFAVKDKEGKVVSVLAGGILDLLQKNGRKTGKTIFMVAYAVTDKAVRQAGLAREAYISAIMDAALHAERQGKQLAFAAGECTYSSERFWNRVGWSRVYMNRKEDKKKYEEVKYVQPALEFDIETGQPAGEEAPEHLMIDSFGRNPPTKEEIIQTVRAFYRWNNTWPAEAFKGNEIAYQSHFNYTRDIANQLESDLQEHDQLILLTQENREKARDQGLLIREHIAADHGHAGKEDF